MDAWAVPAHRAAQGWPAVTLPCGGAQQTQVSFLFQLALPLRMPINQCFFSLLSSDESDYQTEYEEEVLDSQKDDYVNFISSQVEEDSDSVRALPWQ